MLSFWLVLCLSVIGSNSCDVCAKKKSGVHRPCNVTDLDCIRKYFAKNFDCTAAKGPVPDTYGGTRVDIPISHANMTEKAMNNRVITGLSDGEVKEFFINKTSGKVVIEFYFHEISSNSSASIFKFHLKGREPVEIKDAFHAIVRQVSMTLVFSSKNGLEISQSTVYTYIGDHNVVYHLGPGFHSKDPVVHAAMKRFLAKRLTTEQEAYEILGPDYLLFYFENNICKLNDKEEDREIKCSKRQARGVQG